MRIGMRTAIFRGKNVHRNLDRDLQRNGCASGLAVEWMRIGMRSHAGVAAKMFKLLAGCGINIQAISTSEIKISCIMHQNYTELAVRTLHDGFGLSAPPEPTK